MCCIQSTSSTGLSVIEQIIYQTSVGHDARIAAPLSDIKIMHALFNNDSSHDREHNRSGSFGSFCKLNKIKCHVFDFVEIERIRTTIYERTLVITYIGECILRQREFLFFQFVE